MRCEVVSSVEEEKGVCCCCMKEKKEGLVLFHFEMGRTMSKSKVKFGSVTGLDGCTLLAERRPQDRTEQGKQRGDQTTRGLTFEQTTMDDGDMMSVAVDKGHKRQVSERKRE